MPDKSPAVRRLRLCVEQLEHGSGELTGIGFGHILGEHLIELPLKSLFSTSAVEIMDLADCLMHLVKQLAIERLSDEGIKFLADLALIGGTACRLRGARRRRRSRKVCHLGTRRRGRLLICKVLIHQTGLRRQSMIGSS